MSIITIFFIYNNFLTTNLTSNKIILSSDPKLSIFFLIYPRYKNFLLQNNHFYGKIKNKNSFLLINLIFLVAHAWLKKK